MTARRIWRAVVAETSMTPALQPGDTLLLLPAGPYGLPWLRATPRAGSIVVVERDGRLDVKRVAASPRDLPQTPDALWLLGDNAAASNDSRQGGPVPLSALRGIAIFRTGPSGRRGRVR
ncbi:MAG: S26 family signal peptidase [Chloroflexota bacterium]